MDINNIRVTYDRFVDVVFITIIDVIPIKGIEYDHHVIWRYDINNKLAGITILNFRELGQEELYNLVEEFLKDFDIPKSHLLTMIKAST